MHVVLCFELVLYIVTSVCCVQDVSHGEFLRSVRIGYTVGHSVSLTSLVIAIFILCFFR